MPWSRASRTRLKRLFLEGFTVMDIAEPLASFDGDKASAEVRAFMDAHDFDLVGIRKDGVVGGYARREELEGRACGDHMHGFGELDVVSNSASLAETIESLGANGRCFVTVLDQVAAIVTLDDLEKPPVRMYLFGMITIAEMMLGRMIQSRFPDGSWKHYVSDGRLKKADELLQERKRRNQEAELLDCLQFSDKGQVVAKDPELRRILGFESRKAGMKAVKELESLRNNLAHTQRIIASSWERIVRFSSNLEKLLEKV